MLKSLLVLTRSPEARSPLVLPVHRPTGTVGTVKYHCPLKQDFVPGSQMYGVPQLCLPAVLTALVVVVVAAVLAVVSVVVGVVVVAVVVVAVVVVERLLCIAAVLADPVVVVVAVVVAVATPVVRGVGFVPLLVVVCPE